MLLDDIGDYLSSGGLGTPGTDIYLGYMPPGEQATNQVIAVFETGGIAPIRSFGAGPNNAVAERPRIQVVCRADPYDYATARTKAHAVFKLLDGLPERFINGTRYKYAAAVQSPFLLKNKYDTNNRALIACNYDIVKEVST